MTSSTKTRNPKRKATKRKPAVKAKAEKNKGKVSGKPIKKNTKAASRATKPAGNKGKTNKSTKETAARKKASRKVAKGRIKKDPNKPPVQNKSQKKAPSKLRYIRAFFSNMNSVRFRGFPVWAIVGAFVLILCVFLYGPAKRYYCATRDEYILEQEYEILKEQNAEQAKKNQDLTTDQGVVDEARRQGYVEQGETAVNVNGLTQDKSEVRPAPEDAHEQIINQPDPWYVVIGDFIFQYNKNTST